MGGEKDSIRPEMRRTSLHSFQDSGFVIREAPIAIYFWIRFLFGGQDVIVTAIPEYPGNVCTRVLVACRIELLRNGDLLYVAHLLASWVSAPR